MRPKCSLSGKISLCSGRNTPAESTRYTIGRRFSIEISWARKFFLQVTGNQAPAFTVASFATTTTSRPATTPTPKTVPDDGAPPYSSYISYAANKPTSRNSVPGSMRRDILSRAVILPRARCFAIASGPPPRITASPLLRISPRSLRTSASFWRNTALFRTSDPIWAIPLPLLFQQLTRNNHLLDF